MKFKSVMDYVNTDPVCGREISEEEAAAMTDYQSERYYFCSPECKEKFDHSPKRFVRLLPALL